ncbi:hypothetical protein [Mesobacillus harenae]|uniref:hypothetical protein n=1 Tax=Mesobacillus harenae TaxID=2213203 RepID=UPI001581036F|nr:hypothetical protein [Mesobacillus harenae]
MNYISRDEKRKVFRSELHSLKEFGHITQEQYDGVTNAHNEYCREQEAQAQIQLQSAQQASKSNPIQQTIQNPKPRPKPKPEKKRLSAEEVRERNISWSLNLGVIMLLIGGLFVATSNWDTMTDIMKAGSIALVSLLFYGIAYIANRFLKIEKTAFAFIVLGSLFLPIFILSLGWFELLGNYLSIEGEGRFVLGALAGLVLVPIYGKLAQRLGSRLFVWFTFFSLTAGAGFLLRSFNVGSDGFYLGIMVYNSLLIVTFHMLKKQQTMKLFYKELASFAQVNLILSTLFMLLFYNNQVMFGFNLMLTAVIYLSMIYVSGQKEYHFVFSAMLVYGAYQLLEHSPFEEASPVFYALLGFIFLAVPRFLDDQFALNKAFQWTSAIVSLLAFLYITFEGLLLKMDSHSWVLVMAYLLIAGNFVYLANTAKRKIFTFLSPIFLAAAIYEAVCLVQEFLLAESQIMAVFSAGILLYVTAGCFIKHKSLNIIRESSRDTGIGIMYLALLGGLSSRNWTELGIMLLALSFVFYLLPKLEKRTLYLQIAPLVAPSLLGLSILAFGEEIRGSSAFYREVLGLSVHFAFAGLFLISTCFLWKKQGNAELFKSSIFIANGFYTAAMAMALAYPIDPVFVRPAVFFIGIVMYIGLLKFSGFKILGYTAAITALFFYFTVLNALHVEDIWPQALEMYQFLLGALLILGIAVLLVKKEQVLAQGFAWIGYIYLPGALVISLFISWEESYPVFLIGGAVYAAGLRFVQKEWLIKLFLYGSFTSLFVALTAALNDFLIGSQIHIAFLIGSILLAVFWLAATTKFKHRTIYYLVPFSIIGIMAFIAEYPFDLQLYGVTLLYAAALLVFLHHIKWDLVTFLPLLQIYYATITAVQLLDMDSALPKLIPAVLGIGLIAAGQLIYPKLWEVGGKLGIKHIDAYTIFSFLFFFLIYGFASIDEELWVKILPGLLISASLWLQKSRVPAWCTPFVVFLSGAWLLQPYYSLIEHLNIPALFEREAIVLPFIALGIFLQKSMRGQWRKITAQIQWVILILVALALVQDGLQSNTIYDALIVGSLSLLSMLSGMWLRIKSYFFVGAGVLLLNIILQTRPFWGNMPWWAYLLIAGTILISVASFNEWNKQKGTKGDKSIFIKIKEKLLGALKNWQ